MTMQPPKAPEKPLSAYMRFSKKCWESVRVDHPDLKLWEIGSIIGGKWRELTAEVKKEYQDAWNSDKSRYDVEIAAYRNSPEYKNYLKAKSEEEQAQQTSVAPPASTAPVMLKTASPTPPPPHVNVRLVQSPAPTIQVLQQQHPHQQQQQQHLQQRQLRQVIMSSTPQPPPPTTATAADRRIDIQPAEDEGDADSDPVSVKHVARARYMRNQFLADKLFGRGGGETVPDTRQIVTDSKLRVLRRQVHSLTQFNSKAESELEAIQEKHEGRKRRFEESIATFEAEMKKHARKSVVVDKDMIDKQVQELRQAARSLTAPAATESSPVKMETDAAAATTTIVTKGTAVEAPAPVAAVAEVDRGAILTPTNA